MGSFFAHLKCLAFAGYVWACVTLPAAEPDWSRAAETKPPMTVAESKLFMRRLADFVIEHHLKKNEQSAQRGLIYEYFWVEKEKEKQRQRENDSQQWIQGEALDSMHDGAWFACAMVNAYRATGDAFYRDVLTRWQLPFYLKMLNEGDALFTSERNDAQPEKRSTWTNSGEWLLQGKERGFVPYWWDDGASVSLERRRTQQPLAVYPARDELVGKPNPEYRLSGYSLGSSNHLAQDLACMLLLSWLLLKDSTEAEDVKLAAEVAAAARNLQNCRTRHGFASIPVVLAATGIANRDAELIGRIPEEGWIRVLSARVHFQNAMFPSKPEPMKKYPTPGFADDQQYRYYYSIARSKTLTESMAFRVITEPFVETKLFDGYFDDVPRPPGINRFDLYSFSYVDRQPEHRRSERKGPFGGPVPVGSRMGPQNMICCGWALQALRAFPKIWSRGMAEAADHDADLAKMGLLDANKMPLSQGKIRQWHERELGGGLRTWEAIFDAYGYIPTGIGCQSLLGETRWDALSDTGGYAHLISATAQWIMHLEGKRDWEQIGM